jgi:hypothetical protein
MTFDELWGRSTPNSWTRVPRGPVAAAVGAFLFGTTGVLATTTIAGVSLATMGGFLITTAVTSWALAALTPKPPGTSSQTLGNVKEAVGDFDIVYGEIRKGGTVTFMETSDRHGYKVFKDDYLHMIIVLAGHEVSEIGDVYFNDEKVTLDSEGFTVGDRWKSRARVKKHLGSPNQLADPDLVAETSMDINFRGRGIAYLYVRLDWDGDVFGNGLPTITAMVKGRKVYDPRSGNTVWTDNAALCIRDYIEQPFGLNSIQSPTSLSSSDWATAANVCDTLVTKKDNSTEKRYALNGVVSTANVPRSNLQNMLTSCGATLFWGQGKWQFKVGYFPSGPYVSFNADDLRSGISLVTKNSRKENFNAVSGTFLDKDQYYIEVEYPKVESSVFLERDNDQTNVLDMSFPYTTSSSGAQRLAKMAMFRSREEIIIGADFGLKAARVKVGDVVQFTFDRYGFSNKYFEVISWKPTTNGGELKISLVLRETSAAAYDWNAEERDITSNDTNLPDPTSGLNITNLSVTNRQTLQSDGSLLGEVVLSWDAADSAFVDRYVVQWRKSGDTSWSATETDEISIIIPSVKSGVLHNYRVKAVNFAGFSGPWEQLTTSVVGKETPPGIPTNLQTKNLYKAVEVTWVNPTDRDLNHVEIWGGVDSNVSNATLLGKSGGTKFIFNMEPMEEKWFFIRAVDNSDNKSSFTAGIKGTALFIDQSDVDIDVDQLLEDAGLSAVEVLPSLPTSGNFDGRTVYNTEDRQLYIYDDATGTWKPAVEPFNPDDLILERNNFPSDLKPIEVFSSLPTTGNYEGRVVMLTSDGKIYRYNSGSFTASVPTVDLVGQVTGSQISNNAITATKVLDGSISTPKIATNAITANKIAANTITSDKILANAITSDKILANAITSDKILANAITSDKILANAITAGKISAGAISADKIAANSVNTNHLVANAVTAGIIAANSVNTNHLVANAVTAGIIAAGAVSASAIQAGAVTADKINVNSLSAISANLGSIQVGSANIADGAIGSAKISNVIQSDSFVSGPSGAGWRIQKNGVAEFNNVIIRRTIQAASGTVNVGSFTPATQYAVSTGVGTVGILTGGAVDLVNGPGFVQEILTTPIPITEWQGTKKTYIATAGMVGTVNSNDSNNCYWGWDAQVLPLTKWSGNQSLRLRLSFWSKRITSVNDCVVTWRIYEVS